VTWRAPNEKEFAQLERLLSEEFPGRDGLKRQAEGVQVEEIDANGSLSFKTDTSLPVAPVVRRIPIEAEIPDRDGVLVHVLLHVVEGRLSELEILREDSGRVAELAAPEHWQVTIL
jgi:hypothetical protein